MPSASVRSYISDDRQRTRLRVDAWIPLVVLAALIAIAVFGPRLQPGPFVPRVSFVDKSEYAFNVEVANATGAWTLLGTAADGATTAVEAVFDQGSSWTFRFTTQGHIVGDVVLSRADLVSADWRVAIPDEFAARLRAAGVVPTA